MADRWWIQVCPECNGIIGERTQTHNETCPNRHGRMFVPLDVEVVSIGKSEALLEAARELLGHPQPEGYSNPLWQSMNRLRAVLYG